jgi:hypothetical protein
MGRPLGNLRSEEFATVLRHTEIVFAAHCNGARGPFSVRRGTHDSHDLSKSMVLHLGEVASPSDNRYDIAVEGGPVAIFTPYAYTLG